MNFVSNSKVTSGELSKINKSQSELFFAVP